MPETCNCGSGLRPRGECAECGVEICPECWAISNHDVCEACHNSFEREENDCE